MGNLLPRDFLERQPKRWQKSQKKRRVLGTLKKMKEKREKVVQRTIDQAHRDAGHEAEPKRQKAAPSPKADAPPPPASHCTPFGPYNRGVWAAELAPFSPLVVKIPEGVVLCLLRASLHTAEGGPSSSSFVRCRTPAIKQPTTLCVLQPRGAETCPLEILFRHNDASCALAVEGPDVVHLIGSYVRPGVKYSKTDGAAASAGPSGPPPTPSASAPAAPLAVANAKKKEAPAAAAPSMTDLGGGLKFVDTKAGGGRRAERGAKLTCKYRGLSSDHKTGSFRQFDDNGGKPVHFTLGAAEMIRGWDMGLVGMRQGGMRRLVIPPHLGYGEGGAGPVPPKATLIFEIQLLNVVGGLSAARASED